MGHSIFDQHRLIVSWYLCLFSLLVKLPRVRFDCRFCTRGALGLTVEVPMRRMLAATLTSLLTCITCEQLIFASTSAREITGAAESRIRQSAISFLVSLQFHHADWEIAHMHPLSFLDWGEGRKCIWHNWSSAVPPCRLKDCTHETSWISTFSLLDRRDRGQKIQSVELKKIIRLASHFIRALIYQ